MINPIPLKWIKNDAQGVNFAFNQKGIHWFYLDAPITADFNINQDSLKPFVTEILNLAAPLEGLGLSVKLVEIKSGQVKVF